MGIWGFSPFMGSIFLFLLVQPCKGSIQMTSSMTRGFQGAEMRWVDNNGVFLLSKSSNFGFGFQPTKDVTLFLLSIIHIDSNRQVWAANRGSPVQSSDEFVFDNHGNVTLLSGEKVIWSPDTGGKAVSAIRLLDSGNLAMVGDDNSTVWESFRHPTDTLLSNQVFSEGMNLSSNPDVGNLSYSLQFKSGDLQLLVDFKPPQPYWSLVSDPRRVINSDGGAITQAVIDGNSWKLYDKNKVFLLQFIFSSDATLNSTWIAVLGSDGSIEFLSLGGSAVASPTKIPSDSCGTPDHCGAYYSCSSNTCQCPPGLLSRNCETGIVSPCDSNGSKAPTEMISAGEDLNYFALDFVSPTSKTDLNSCTASCAGNCSCVAVFYNNATRNCYQFDNVGSFKVDSGSSYAAFVKVSTSANVGGGGNSSHSFIAIIISVVMVICFWESFRHPTDTLLSNQVFSNGMSLSRNPVFGNLSYFLQLKSGDLQLFVDFKPPQPYWSMDRDFRGIVNSYGGAITQAVMDRNSWNFYDKDKVLLLQFIFSSDDIAGLNSTWISVPGSDGSIEFLSHGGSVVATSPTKIPSDSCGTPDHCGAYFICSYSHCPCSSNTCHCPPGLLSRSCKTGIVSPCDDRSGSNTEMI